MAMSWPADSAAKMQFKLEEYLAIVEQLKIHYDPTHDLVDAFSIFDM